MAFSPGPESIQPQQPAKDKEAPKTSRVSKKAVKGFYYYAAEYQREKQKDRNIVDKTVRGVIEPFMIHARALRLWLAAKHRGGGTSAVLNTEFTKRALDGVFRGKFSDAEGQKILKQFEAKSQAHGVVEKSQTDFTDAQRANISGILQQLFSAGGELDQTKLQEYQSQTGMSKDDLLNLANVIKNNKDAFQTPDEMMRSVPDEVIYGGLNLQQQDQARDLFKATLATTGLTAINYAKTALVVGFLATNPVGLIGTIGVVGGSALLSGITRVPRLIAEGKVHDISKSKGIDTSQHYNMFSKLLGVDWDADPQSRKWQIVRAAGVGAAIALVARGAPEVLHHVVPAVEDLFHHGQEGIQALGGHAQDLGQSAGSAAHNALDKLPHGGNGGGAAALADKGDLNIGAGNFHENFLDAAKDHTVHYLPDTANHDWQQLHTIAQEAHDAQGNVLHDAQGHVIHEIKLSYNGVDDGIPHDQHFIDVQMGNGQHVFLQNDTVLAINGPDANVPIPLYDAAGHIFGYTHSVNLANELGLTQGKIENFSNLSEYAKNGHWFGTQDASDLQKILQDRGIYGGNGDNGEYLWGYRLGGGYFRSKHSYQTRCCQRRSNHRCTA